MHVERQGSHECALATIAALCNVPLSIVREEACEHARVATWRALFSGRRNTTARFWGAVTHVSVLYGGEHVATAMRSAHMPAGLYGEDRIVLPDSGRGTVRVRKGGVGHVMPWSNGLVQDPELADDLRNPGISLQLWRELHPGWSIRVIVTLVEAAPGVPSEAYPNPNPSDLGF